MFHLDMTFKDVRVIATHSAGGFEKFDCFFHDNLSGKQFRTQMHWSELGDVITVSLDPDGECLTPDRHHFLASLFDGAPAECIPIP